MQLRFGNPLATFALLMVLASGTLIPAAHAQVERVVADAQGIT